MKIAEQEISLFDYMGTDLTVVNAARVSFDKNSNWEWEIVNEETCYSEPKLSDKDAKLITYLAKHKHWSPFSHAMASFRVKAPIFVARQLAKHQVGFSWNEVSRRYVDSEPEFYMPEFFRKKADNVKQGSSDEEFPYLWPENLTKALCEQALNLYKDMIDEKICPEQARMVLPQNTMTEWIWTGSLYGWARVCQLRLDPHTQKETREIAQMINNSMEDIFPYSWKALMEAQ